MIFILSVASIFMFYTWRNPAGQSIPYASDLIAYMGVFIVVFAIAFITFKDKADLKPHQWAVPLMIILLFAGLMMRIGLSMLEEGYPFDIQSFQNWAHLAENDLFNIYNRGEFLDYPPFYLYILFIVGKIAKLTIMKPYLVLLVKLPAILADVASAYLIYKLSIRKLSSEMSLLISAFYLLNPAVFLNSALWGQVDSFFTLLVLLGIVFLTQKRIGLSTVFFVLSVLMKPQGIIFMPVLFFELVRLKNIKEFIKSVSVGVLTALAVIMPFSVGKGFEWIITLYTKTMGQYPYASLNAFNLYYLLDANFAIDTVKTFLFSFHTWGMIAIVLITLFTWLIYIKGNTQRFAPAAAFFLITGVFMLASRMHERYLFPAVLLALLAYVELQDRRFLALAAGFSLTTYANTQYILHGIKNGLPGGWYDNIPYLTSYANLILFAFLIYVLADLAFRKKTVGVLKMPPTRGNRKK